MEIIDWIIVLALLIIGAVLILLWYFGFFGKLSTGGLELLRFAKT